MTSKKTSKKKSVTIQEEKNVVFITDVESASTDEPDEADIQSTSSETRYILGLQSQPLPCVTNAYCHVQAIKKTLEKWYRQGKHFFCKTSSRDQSKDVDSDSLTSEDLYVEGIAIGTRESRSAEALKSKIDEILTEIIDMMERLETDRQNVERALAREMLRHKYLNSRFEKIALHEQRELALAVQQEKEACMKDISTLKRTLRVETTKLEQIQAKLLEAQLVNTRLLEDINSAKKQIPTASENIELQKSIIRSIETAQEEAENILRKTRNELHTAKRDLEDRKYAVAKEKRSSNNLLREMEKELMEKLELLNKMKIREKSLLSDIEFAEEVVHGLESKVEVIKEKMNEILQDEEMENEKILQLGLQIDKEQQQNDALEEELTALSQTIQNRKVQTDIEIKTLKNRLKAKHKTYKNLCKENMECEQNIEDHKLKIINSERSVKRMEEEMKQMHKTILDNQEQWEKALDDLNAVMTVYHEVKVKLEEQEELNYTEEMRIKTEMDKLRETLNAVKTALEMLKIQCASLKEELKQHKNNSQLVNQKLQKDFKEAQSITDAMESRFDYIKLLVRKLETVHTDHAAALISLDEEKEQAREKLKNAKDLLSATKDKYDNTVIRISELRAGIEEFHISSDKLEENIAQLPAILTELKSDLDVVECKNRNATNLMNTLNSDINNWKQRTMQSMQKHSAIIIKRENQLEEKKKGLKSALKENKQLAKKYEMLQKMFLDTRTVTLQTLKERNHARDDYDYYVQLSLLQKRMHTALEKYFKHRNLYNLAELELCQNLSQENYRKIKAVETKMSEEIQLITTFLQTLACDFSTIDGPGVNKQGTPDATGSNE